MSLAIMFCNHFLYFTESIELVVKKDAYIFHNQFSRECCVNWKIKNSFIGKSAC